MIGYALRRLVAVPFLLLGVSLVTFALLHLTPGSPVDDFQLSRSDARRLNPAEREAIEETLGLNRPVHEQYLGWIAQLGRGDLGVSFKLHRPVGEIIAERLPNTLLLTTVSLLLALVVAAPAGVWSAVKRNSIFDQSLTVGGTVAQAVPDVWLGLVFILLFAVQFSEWGFPAFPTGGAQTVPDGGDLTDRLRHLVLPCLTLAVPQIAVWMRYVRMQTLEVLGQDHVRTARAKGLPEGGVLRRHVLRNALLPMVALGGLTLPGLFAGAAIAETVFAWPGVGQVATQAAVQKDYTLVMAMTMFIATLTVLSNLLADLLAAVVDPRVRLG